MVTVCGDQRFLLGSGNSTKKNIGNLPAIAQPKPGRQAQRLPDESGQAIHADVRNHKMKTMIKLLGIIVLMILFIQCNDNSKKQSDHDFSVKIDKIWKTNDDTLKDWIWKANFYKLNVSLLNNTDSTIHYWMNTCSWDDNFVTNNQNIKIIGPIECTRNFPKIFDLDKNNRINFSGLIAVKDSFDFNKMIKIGFIYIKLNERERLIEIIPPLPGDSIQLRKHKTHNRIIWSDYFKIK